MKRLLAAMLALMLVISLMACGKKDGDSGSDASAQSQNSDQADSGSASGSGKDDASSSSSSSGSSSGSDAENEDAYLDDYVIYGRLAKVNDCPIDIKGIKIDGIIAGDSDYYGEKLNESAFKDDGFRTLFGFGSYDASEYIDISIDYDVKDGEEDCLRTRFVKPHDMDFYKNFSYKGVDPDSLSLEFEDEFGFAGTGFERRDYEFLKNHEDDGKVFGNSLLLSDIDEDSAVFNDYDGDLDILFLYGGKAAYVTRIKLMELEELRNMSSSDLKDLQKKLSEDAKAAAKADHEGGAAGAASADDEQQSDVSSKPAGDDAKSDEMDKASGEERVAAYEAIYGPICNLAEEYNDYEEWPDKSAWGKAELPDLDFSDTGADIAISYNTVSGLSTLTVTFESEDEALMDDIYEKVYKRVNDKYPLGEDTEVADQDIAGTVIKYKHSSVSDTFIKEGLHLFASVIEYNRESSLLGDSTIVTFGLSMDGPYYWKLDKEKN